MTKLHQLTHGTSGYILPAPDFQIEYKDTVVNVYSPDYRAEHEIIQYANSKLPANWLLRIDTEAEAQCSNPRKMDEGQWVGYWRWQLVKA